eukprot:6041482-Prymnesium_polylepis.1
MRLCALRARLMDSADRLSASCSMMSSSFASPPRRGSSCWIIEASSSLTPTCSPGAKSAVGFAGESLWFSPLANTSSSREAAGSGWSTRASVPPSRWSGELC